MIPFREDDRNYPRCSNAAPAQLDDQKLFTALSNKEVVSEAEMSLRPTTACFWLQDA
jgi:hypothetical protein